MKKQQEMRREIIDLVAIILRSVPAIEADRLKAHLIIQRSLVLEKSGLVSLRVSGEEILSIE